MRRLIAFSIVVLVGAVACEHDQLPMNPSFTEEAEAAFPNTTPEPAVAAAAAAAVAVAPAASPGDVLIYGPSMSAPTAVRPQNEATLATAAGHTVTVVSAAVWAGLTQAQFASYDAIVFGDPTCSGLGTLAAAEANRATWSAAITGNMYVQGTDPQWHQVNRPEAVVMITEGINFAAAGAGTGLYMSLSCYYGLAAPNTPVTVLDAIGDFRVLGQGGCTSNVNIVDPAHPSMAGLTNAGLSNWGCSPHEFITSFPANFNVMAEAVRPADGAVLPFIIATPAVIPVDIDIKPGSYPNSINLGERGLLPVAILTTAAFNAANVDPATVRLGDEAGTDTPVATTRNGTLHAALQDVDGDGDMDMILHFSVPALVANGDLHAGTTELVLTGQTTGGQQIRGSDSVRITPNN